MKPARRWRSETIYRRKKEKRGAQNYQKRLWRRVYAARFAAGLEHCRWCGTGTTELTFDHLIPVADGGANSLSNMTLLCNPCNAAKGADRWEELISLAAEEEQSPPERRWVEIAQCEAAAYSYHAPCAVCGQWERISRDGQLDTHGFGCPGGRPLTARGWVEEGEEEEVKGVWS